MAKRKKKKTQGLQTILIYLAILFTAVLFTIKLFSRSVGWLDVFAPLLVVFLIIFLLSVLKIAAKKL
ncbi:MAG TPA: hypothetical protein VF487_08320 [Chitinophagaceae bacterium]